MLFSSLFQDQFVFLKCLLKFNLQGLQVHLTSTKGPIDVFLCPDENSPDSPVKNENSSLKGNSSPFMKVLDGGFAVEVYSV